MGTVDERFVDLRTAAKARGGRFDRRVTPDGESSEPIPFERSVQTQRPHPVPIGQQEVRAPTSRQHLPEVNLPPRLPVCVAVDDRQATIELLHGIESDLKKIIRQFQQEGTEVAELKQLLANLQYCIPKLGN